MAGRNFGRDITSIKGGIIFRLPGGGTKQFKDSRTALTWFDLNYGNSNYHLEEYIPTETSQSANPQSGTEQNPVQLNEVVVVGKAPKKEETPSVTPTRRGIDMYIGRNYSPSFNKHFYGTSDFDALFGKSRVEGVKRAWQRNPQAMWNWTDGGNMAVAFVTAPFALEAGAAAYSVPEIAGALNLYGAYEGLGRLTSDEGVKKTWNHIQNGEWWDATKSAGGDVLDVAMSLPFLNRVRLGSKWLYNGAKGEVVNLAINRFSPNYSSTFNWRTGRFTLTPRPGVNVPEGTPVKFGPTLGLPSPTLSLPGSVSLQPVRTLSLGAEEAPTYGSMNKVADALEAGILPTNEEIAAASRVTRPPRFYGGEEISSLPTSVNGQPIPPAVLPGGSTNIEYYQALANHFNRVVESPEGYAIFPRIEEGLPRPPREVNNVASINQNGRSAIDAIEEASPQIPTTGRTANSFDNLLTSNSYQSDASGIWLHPIDGSTFTFSDDGNIMFETMGLPKSRINPEDMEAFIRARSTRTPYTQGPYRSLLDFLSGNQYTFENLSSVWDGNYSFKYRHPSGVNLPIKIKEGPGVLLVGVRGGTPIEIPITEGTTKLEVYDAILNYTKGIEIGSLTPEQESLIQSRFPNERHPRIRLRGTDPITRRFSSDNGAAGLVFNPISNTFSLNGRGFRSLHDEPIANLSEEVLSPIKVPTIITSSEGLPAFSRVSLGTDWGRALGVDPGYNGQIDFGLQRPRPTIDLVRKALGIEDGWMDRVHQGDASFTIEDFRPEYRDDFPYVEIPERVPIIHLNMTPSGGIELSQADKSFVGKKLLSLSQNAKGVDIASTGKVNPTVSRFVSDLTTAPNLSDMDRYNLLKMFLENPDLLYVPRPDYNNYSPFTWHNNAIMGNKPRRFYTEPSMNTYMGGFNNYGSILESPVKGLFNLNPSQLGSKSPDIDLGVGDRATILQKWMLTEMPALWAMPQDRTRVPFPITTIKKKGGRLVKKKFNLNGKKTCK